MGDTATDFITRFHSLEGITINDRKKNFNKLIRDPSFLTIQKEIHSALDKLEPKTYLESLFKIDALIYFKHTRQLLETMKQGNIVFIKRILKQYWFFKEAFENMDSNSLVNDFLPCLSFAVRMKVLKRLSLVLTEEKIDEVYTAIYKRYGLWIAIKILHACSKEKIQKVLNTEEITLGAHQVLHLFKRNSDLFVIYIGYYRKTFNKPYAESNVSRYISQKNPALLFELEMEQKMSASRLGRGTSKKAFELVKEDVSSKNFDFYLRLLNRSVLVKKMGTEFKTAYVEKCSRKSTDISPDSECRKLLHYYPKNKRWELFKDAFLTKFPRKSVNDLFLILGSDVNDLNMCEDLKVKYAEFNYQITNDESYLKYVSPSKSLPLIKEKIKQSLDDEEKRKQLVMFLLDICKANNDSLALEDVLKYIRDQHSDESVSFTFIKDILSHVDKIFKLQDFNRTHWEIIDDIVKLMIKISEFYVGQIGNIVIRQLEFFVKNGEDFRDHLFVFMSEAIFRRCFSLPLDNPSIEIKLIKEMTRILPEVLAEQNDLFIYKCKAAFVRDVLDFNEKHPNYYLDVGQIEYFRNFVIELTTIYRDGEYSSDKNYGIVVKMIQHKYQYPQCTLPIVFDDKLVHMITRCICINGRCEFFELLKFFTLKRQRNDFENLLLKSYFENVLNKRPDANLVNWFLMNDPTVLVPFLSKIYDNVFDLDFRLIKLYSHFDFDKEALFFYRNILESDKIDKYAKVVDILRILLPTTEFTDLIDCKFVPVKTKLDLEDVNMRKLYNVQCELVKGLHKVEEPSKMLPIVLKFCIEAYSKSVLPSLQGSFYKSREKELYMHVDRMSEKMETSIRKHAIFFSCELLNQEHLKNVLSKEGSRVSCKKHFFTITLKYFKKNPSEEVLNLITENMKMINKSDTEALAILAGIDKIPKKYKSFYIEKCWTFYESLKTSGVTVETYLQDLLKNALNDHIDNIITISPSFIDKIINNYFCATFNSNIHIELIVTLLINSDNLRSEFLEIVLKKLKTKQNNIKPFFKYLTSLKLPKQFLVTFDKHWNEHFELSDAFEEHVMIKLLLFDFENLAQKINLYLEELIETLTLNSLELFKPVFKNFISLKDSTEQYELLCDMLKLKSSSVMCTLTLYVIKPVDDNDEENIHLYQSLMEIIQNSEEPIVRLYLNEYNATKKLLEQNNIAPPTKRG